MQFLPAVMCWWLPILAVCSSVLVCSTPAAAGSPPPSTPASTPPAHSAAGRLRVHIRGNRVLLDSVLAWIMALPATGPATPEMARRAEMRLQSFFRQTGYDLARVRALAADGELYVFVDEGRLDKIFFTGVGASQALRFQLDLRLPGNVYNRQRVHEELARLQKKYAVGPMHAQLVVLEPKPTTVIQLEDFVSALKDDDGAGDIWRESRGRYALRIKVDADPNGDDLDYGVRYLLPYGLEPYASWARGGLWFRDDRYRLSVEVAGLRDKLLTHAQSELYWAAPTFQERLLRPTLSLRGRLDNFQRDSLGLDAYYELRLSAVASVGIQPNDHLRFAAGVGYGYENLFGLQTTARTPDYVQPGTRQYPLGRLQLDWMTHTNGLRRDKYNRLDLEFELFQVAQGMVRRGELDYRHVWEFGYQDLFWRVRGTSVTGSGAQWQDEEPIASPILRAVAGPEKFARNMGQMGLEFRLSLYRDILKVSASGGAAVVGLVDRSSRNQYLNFFASIGPGVHVLFLDNFQADAYYSFGWRQSQSVNGQFSFSVAKVF